MTYRDECVRQILAAEVKIWKVQERERGDGEQRTQVRDWVIESVVRNGEERETRDGSERINNTFKPLKSTRRRTLTPLA
jgi:hypothetical protein